MFADWALARQVAVAESDVEKLAEIIFGEDVYDRIDSAVGTLRAGRESDERTET